VIGLPEDPAAAARDHFPDPRTAWGRFADHPQTGALNYVTAAGRVAAAGLVRQGRSFTLGIPIFDPRGDPLSPDRPRAMHVMYRDWSHYLAGRRHPLPGGVASVDDGVFISCHGTTHVDALGHIIVDGTMWDGRDARSASAGLDWASIAPIAEQGIFCRAVLADIASYRGEDRLRKDHHVTLRELSATLGRQGVLIGEGDVILLRTGSIARFYQDGPDEFFRDYSEPGLSDELELIEWFSDNRISGLGSDTLSNELPRSPATGAGYPLHHLLLRNLGVIFHEALWLEDLAADCAADHCYEGLYIAAPLKMVGVSGSPVNPLFVK
jgi:kynurenine formamidase